MASSSLARSSRVETKHQASSVLNGFHDDDDDRYVECIAYKLNSFVDSRRFKHTDRTYL
jgi:hypothetical protein